jgi:signal transduction histidine kinase
MDPPHPSPKPRFLWQGILILMPVVLLAAVGAYSLRSDQRLAEQEIRDRATWLVEKAHATLGPIILTNLDFYLAYRAELRRDTNELVGAWYRYLSLLTNRPLVNLASWFPPSYSNFYGRLAPWQVAACWSDANHLGFDHQFRFYTNGWPLYLSAASFSPLNQQYRPFQGEDSPVRTKELLFQRAQEMEWRSAQLEDVIDAYATFLKADPAPEAAVPVHYILGVLEMKRGQTNAACGHWEEVRRNGGAWLPGTRLPVKPLALYQLARLRLDELPPLTFRDLGHAITDQQSPLTPLLLDKAEALLDPERHAERALLRACRSKWELDQRSRTLIDAVRAQLGPIPWTNHWVWWDWMGQRYLLTAQFATAAGETHDASIWVPDLPGQPGLVQRVERATLTNQSYLVTVLPKIAVEWAASRAIAQAWAKSRPPAGLTLSLDWDGEPLRLAPYEPGPAQTAPLPLPLAAARAPVAGHNGLAHEFTVRLVGSDLSALYAPLRLRRQLFGTLILCSALTALAGFLWTQRAFRRQVQLNELKTNFVSSVSHELRAPIASVRLMAESLERGKVTEQTKQHDYFHFIVQECRRLSSLVENVLDFARIEQGRKQYEFESADIGRLVQQTVQLMEPYAAEKQVHLGLHPDAAQLPDLNAEMTADGRAIQQALVNLIDNAIKHSPPGETVTIALEVLLPDEFSASPEARLLPGPPPRSIILLSVADHGPGIPPAEHERIFERFYRRGSELRRETQGAGIGLSIVRHVIEAHGGRVTVQSEVGQGSRFTIVLPADESRQTKGGRTNEEEGGQTNGGRRMGADEWGQTNGGRRMGADE